MNNNEQEPTEPRSPLNDDEAGHLEALALPKNPHAQFEAAMKPHKDIQEQLKALALPKSQLDEIPASLKSLNDHQKHLAAFALPKSPYAGLEAAMKPHNDFREQLASLAITDPASMKSFNVPQERLKALRLAKHPISGDIKSNQPISSPQELGEIIRSRRTANGMNQQQLADLAGVGRRFLSELENGKQSLEFGKVLRVASAIGIDLIAKQK
jgi:y4mF family transcriptional regulator